ncbi:MAG: amino acid ABC transporter permease [Atopobiaceae bacterium]|nr:amino acid ABC transporter permease [Atopobiaceae bacterium]
MLGRIASFFKDDHRYVFLGTSAFALVGLWLAMQPRTPSSFLAQSYALEVVLYYLLVAWLVLSAVALVNKLIKWRDYGTSSPFVRESLRRMVRIASYVMWAIVCVFIVDRLGMGLVDLVRTSTQASSNPTDFLSSTVYMLSKSSSIFATGIITTIELATFGTIIAFFLALLMVFLRIQEIDRSDNDFIRFLKTVGSGFAKLYSTVIRGTPMMIQGMIIYFAGFGVLRGTGMSVSEIGAIWSTFVAGLVTISLNSTAYMMEVLRGGIEAVDSGQTEAARSLGLSQWQAMMKVVFPQGVKNAVPALSNELVINIKDSSVLSVIGVFDLMFATTTVAGIYFKQSEIYVVAAVCYLILTMTATWLLNKLSRRLTGAAPRTLPSSN